MKYLLALLITTTMNTTPLSFDFGTTCNTCHDWFVVLDGVMGGLSTGSIEQTKESVIFRGSVSLENNGGFASLRTPYQSYDLSGYTTVTVRYKSTGQDFGLTLNKYKRFWRPNYKINLPITQGEWKTVTYNLADFGTYRLGQPLEGHPDKEDLADIIRIGLISNTKAATDFEIEVDKIIFE
ncbi:CIA30 family protein [Dokdonia sp. LLG6352-1]|uniref:CIA30 family protein n=1 Tax=Dokdonia sp. LLG6352-1 TaxID=3160831 RepID=UPI00386BA28C